jgi:hypothetical protein
VTDAKLTPPRLRALEALSIAHAAKRQFVRRSHETHADPARPWTFSINGNVARSLEKMGLAEGKLVDVADRVHEPSGNIVVDLGLLSFCTTKYRLTPKGRAVLRNLRRCRKQVGGVWFVCIRRGLWISDDRRLAICRMLANTSQQSWELYRCGPLPEPPNDSIDWFHWAIADYVGGTFFMGALAYYVKTEAKQMKVEARKAKAAAKAGREAGEFCAGTREC